VNKLRIDREGPAEAVVEETEGEELRKTAAIVVEGEDGEEAASAALPKRAVLNGDGTVTLSLLKPVTLTIRTGGKEKQETYKELVFRELTGADVRLVTQEQDEMRRTIMALARSTGMTSIRMNVLFDRLSQRDVKGATEVIAYFQG
jgi:hypothetical protein